MSDYSILFPAFSDALREPDPEFKREAEALDRAGIPWRVVDLAALHRGDIDRALRYFGTAPPGPMIYRGVILRPKPYRLLSESLARRGCPLLTSPAAYRRALLFPLFYPVIADHSFPATWIAGSNPMRAVQAARKLGPPPYFIKDYAKSAKEIWPEGCVVSCESEMGPAIRALKKYRGEWFEGGIVIRPLLKLRYLGESAWGRKVYEEYRLVFFQGELISISPYDRVGGDPASLRDFSFLAGRIRSRFFTADVVVTESGQQYLLEIGDGGCSGLAPGLPAPALFSAISRILALGSERQSRP